LGQPLGLRARPGDPDVHIVIISDVDERRWPSSRHQNSSRSTRRMISEVCDKPRESPAAIGGGLPWASNPSTVRASTLASRRKAKAAET
jgi:hypothetical protein